jgi:hypothetical protein
MAKGPVPRGGTSKVKLFYMEADLQEGEITQIAQMIQNTLGGRATVQRLNGPSARSLPSPVNGEAHELDGSAEIIEDAEVEEAAPTPAKARAERSIRTPNLDSAVKPDDDPSFADYIRGMDVKSYAKKILAAAAWLQEQRNGMAITGDRAFTCFRFVEWPTKDVDFDQPLRNYKSMKLFEQGGDQKGTGEYSINDLGLKKAAKMRTGS